MAKCKNLRTGVGLEGNGMTDRERLIDLMIEAKRTDPETGSFTDYLADYLLEHGVIVLPCKVGDTVYIKGEPVKISFLHIDNEITYCVQFDCEKFDCFSCPFYEDEVSREGEHDCRTYGYMEFTESDIGKTVFLTREEAEKALKERER